MADGFNPFSGLGGMFSGGGGFMTVLTAIVVGLLGIGIIWGIFWYFWKRKSYNIRVEFKLPRSIKYLKDGNKLEPGDIAGFIGGEWGKARYNPKAGVVWLKRKGKKEIPMKPFNLARYLQGEDLLTVVQTGANDYTPVMPESFCLYQDEHGEEATLLSLRADTSESKAWKNSFERDAKSAYSISSLLAQYAPVIVIGLVIVLWGIQIIMVKRGICGG